MTTRARRRDRHAFYEAAVQGVDWDLDFLVRAYRKRSSREPRLFREDFCSTAALATAWALRHPRNRAWGVDLDPEPLAWAKEHRLPHVREVAARVTLVQSDVRRAQEPRVDVACALNFSWWVFHRRADLMAYLRAARASLKPGGVLVLNAFGGTRAEKELVERTRKRATNTPDGERVRAFTYVWEQASFNAVNRQLLAYIHFEFDDRPRFARAFVYDWRMWTLPEPRTPCSKRASAISTSGARAGTRSARRTRASCTGAPSSTTTIAGSGTAPLTAREVPWVAAPPSSGGFRRDGHPGRADQLRS